MAICLYGSGFGGKKEKNTLQEKNTEEEEIDA
jgi:hypothetical protein